MGRLDPAFRMCAGDRFHKILVAGDVRYESAPDMETVITFFIIRRRHGKFDIFNVLKTFDAKRCRSRQVQAKTGIAADDIDIEVQLLTGAFTAAVEAGSSKRLKWDILDLSHTPDPHEQVIRIRNWGKVTVYGDGILSLN